MLFICRQSLLGCIPREDASWCVSPEITLPNGVRPANQRKRLNTTTRRCSGTCTVPDPDLEIRRGGGGRGEEVSSTLFSARRSQFGLKIRGAPEPLPRLRH